MLYGWELKSFVGRSLPAAAANLAPADMLSPKWTHARLQAPGYRSPPDGMCRAGLTWDSWDGICQVKTLERDAPPARAGSADSSETCRSTAPSLHMLHGCGAIGALKIRPLEDCSCGPASLTVVLQETAAAHRLSLSSLLLRTEDGRERRDKQVTGPAGHFLGEPRHC